jgi:hypothetical protein
MWLQYTSGCPSLSHTHLIAQLLEGCWVHGATIAVDDAGGGSIGALRLHQHHLILRQQAQHVHSMP